MVGKTDAEQEAAIDSPSFCALQPNCRKRKTLNLWHERNI